VKVLIATTTTQGERIDDFSSTVEGELAFDAGPCERAIREQDPDCPCSISFRGVASGEQTTTVMVADLDFGLRDYERAFRDGLKRRGICAACATRYAHDARMLALRWPVGTVLEREYLDIRARVAG